MNYLFDLNPNYTERDTILEAYYIGKESGGTRRFEAVPLSVLERLIEENFIDLNDYQNDAPTVQEFWDFLRQYPSLTVHGYSVSPNRSDYRLSIEGLAWESTGEPCSEELKEAFKTFCRSADELSVDNDSLYSWWD